MKIYQVTFIDNEEHWSSRVFSSKTKAKKWIKDNESEWEQVFDDVTEIVIPRLNKKTLIELLNR